MAEQKKSQASESTKAPPENPPAKRLYRSRGDKMIGGVCGGLAEYFNLDANIIRVIWVAAVLLGGVGVLAYIICWIVIPENPAETIPAAGHGKSSNSSLIWGGILIVLGFIFLAGQLDWFDAYPFFFNWRWHPWWFWHGRFDLLLPVGIILIGVYYLMAMMKKDKPAAGATKPEITGGQTMEKKLTRSVDDRMIGGVCGGLAKYFGVDPSFVRIAFALLTLAGGGFLGIIAYVVMLIIIPEESAATTGGSGSKQTSKAK